MTLQPTPKHLILVLSILILGACNMPRATESPADDPGLIHTIAAQTVEAQMTQDALNNGQNTDPNGQPQDGGNSQGQSPSETPAPTQQLTPTNTQPPPPTNTTAPTPTFTPIPCDQIGWGKDITVPDNTQMVPGESFTKVWRIKNIGSCTWTSGYDLIFDSGDSMGAPATQKLTTGTVAPGQEIDVSVVLTAPDDPGTYQGFFKLRNPSGGVFGLGPQYKPFWVKIVVPEKTGVMFDFITEAADADWGSGVTPIKYASPGDIDLTYGGPDTNTDGFAMTKDDLQIEGQDDSGVILETVPKQEEDGYIVGRYPKYKVGAGDYIKGRIGFLRVGGVCGVGNAIFQISYTINDDLGTMTTLGTWNETCDGTMRKINIDLSPLKGQEVRFYVVILANGAATDDFAMWDSFAVMR